MPNLDEMVGSLLIAGLDIIVIGTTVVLVMHRMIAGDLRTEAGILAIGVAIFLMFVSIKPPHPAVPGVALVVVITLVAFFPFALTMLEKAEMHAIDTELLDKAYAALRARPDNTAAKLQIAKMLHDQGLREHAIAVAGSALGSLSTEVDPVHNRSIRDLFYNEAILLRRWHQEQAMEPKRLPPFVKCPACGKDNAVGDLLCAGCGRPYLLDAVSQTDSGGKIMSKLVIAWAAVAAFFVGGIAVALNFEGVVRLILFFSALAAVGAFITWLFRPKSLHGSRQ